MEGGESEAESDSGVSASMSSVQTSEAETRVEVPSAAHADEKRRSARRKEYVLCLRTQKTSDNLTFESHSSKSFNLRL